MASFPAETRRRRGVGFVMRFLRVSVPLREMAFVTASWGFGFTVVWGRDRRRWSGLSFPAETLRGLAELTENHVRSAGCRLTGLAKNALDTASV